jgi:trehalose/maltose hydrolase-like predicted phosphorylase
MVRVQTSVRVAGQLPPVLTQVAPGAAAQALRWRHSTLPLATARAAQLGLAGAAFPWRTIHGEECSSYWPAGTDAFHIDAAAVAQLSVEGEHLDPAVAPKH